MARKAADLTPRQRQSQQIMREKASRKKRQAIMRRCALGGGAFLAVVVLGGGVWGWKSGAASRAVGAIADGAYHMTVRGGFSVKALYLEGRNRTAMAEIDKALEVHKGDPILRVSLGEVRERLEKIESIKHAAVERALPGTLYVRIVEREPVALWQYQGKLALVDDNGVVMNGIDIGPYRQLPLIIGEDAPKHIAELLTMLSEAPPLAQRFANATWVGERRWNIGLKAPASGRVEVKLPEANPVDAWKKLAELQATQQVLDRDIKEIDLRLQGRMFIKVSPDSLQDKHATNARDT